MNIERDQEKSFCRLIVETAERLRDKNATSIVGREDEKYTFGETLRIIRAVAHRLEREGIGFGDRVCLLGENSPRWAMAYMGILFHGAVCVPLDPHAKPETLAHFFKDSQAKLAFVGSATLKHYEEVRKNLENQVPTVILDEDRRENFGSFNDWMTTDYPKELDGTVPAPKGDDLALLMYTSGTTGKPKAVPITHGNIYCEATGVQSVVHISENEVILSVLPLFHVFAQVANLWIAAQCGARVVYLNEVAPSELEKAFKTGEITLLTGVPRLWYMFHKKIFDNVALQPKFVQKIFRRLLKLNTFLRNKFKINLGRKFFKKVHDGFGGKLNITITAGSRFDEGVAKDFHALGFTIIQGYGLTETTGAASSTRFEDNRVGSVGYAVNNAEIKINEPDADGAGEVLIRGCLVMKGYYNNPEANKEAFTEDGWFRTGDLGKFVDGHLYIVGRSKDVIILPSGKNVYPEDVEDHYSKSPYISEICVLGIKDSSSAGAEKLVAVVVPNFEFLKQKKVANAKETIRHDMDTLGRGLPDYQRVRDYIIRAEELPRTSTRKVRRFELQKQIEEGNYGDESLNKATQLKLTDEDRRMLESPSAKVLIKAIKTQNAEAEDFHPSQNLEIDLGLDSLARAEMLAVLEQNLGVEFENERASQALTFGEVVKLIDDTADVKNADAIEMKSDWQAVLQSADPNLPEIKTLTRKRTFTPTLAVGVFSIFRLLGKLLFKMDAKGQENLSQIKRPFIVAPNHQSYLDPLFVASNYPADVLKNTFHVGAKEYFESGFMGWLARWLNIVPIDESGKVTTALQTSAAGLKAGKILNIYPEGERAFDGELHDFKRGAAILAVEMDLPIVPVALDGLHKVWGRGESFRFAPVKIRYGTPFYARDIISGETSNEEKYAAVTAELKARIQKMLDEMRGSSLTR